MESYLQLVVGPYLLLVPAVEVIEVQDYSARAGEQSFISWRDKILPVVSLRHLLMLPEQKSGVMLVRGQKGSANDCLIADQVVGLVRLADSDLQPVPVAAGRSTVFFDKVWLVGESGRQALRLRGLQGRVPCDSSALIH